VGGEAGRWVWVGGFWEDPMLVNVAGGYGCGGWVEVGCIDGTGCMILEGGVACIVKNN